MVTIVPPAARQRGFLMVSALLLLLITGLLTLTLARKWEHEDRLMKERDLLWIGAQFRNALAGYAIATPAGMREQPSKLEDLLRDRRSTREMQHLRKMFLDPMTGKADWVVVRSARGGIVGVHSRAEGKPMKRDGLWPVELQFANATKYSDWVFAPSMWLSEATRPPASK